MATTTCVNGQTVVHKTSDGKLTTAPDVCLTPVGNLVVPIPYTNVAVSMDTSNGSKSVFVDGNPVMLKDSVFPRAQVMSRASSKGSVQGRHAVLPRSAITHSM